MAEGAGSTGGGGFNLGLLSPFSGSGGFSMPSSSYSALSDRSPINIAPVGVNLGAILQPVSQGSPENGGIGADYFSRYSGVYGHSKASDITGSNLLPWIIAAGAGVIALVFLVR